MGARAASTPRSRSLVAPPSVYLQMGQSLCSPEEPAPGWAAVTVLKRFAFAKVRVSIIQDSCFHAPCGHQRRTCHLSGHREDLKGGPPMRGSRDLVKAAERWTGHSWTSAGTSVSTRPARPQPTKASYRCVPGTLWQQLGCCHLQFASTGNGEKPSRRSASTRRRRAQATRNRQPTGARRLAGGRAAALLNPRAHLHGPAPR